MIISENKSKLINDGWVGILDKYPEYFLDFQRIANKYCFLPDTQETHNSLIQEMSEFLENKLGFYVRLETLKENEWSTEITIIIKS